MKKIKILYFTVDLSDYTFKNREYFKRVLAEHPDVLVHFVKNGGHVNDIIKKLQFSPDFIYIDDYKKIVKHGKPILGLDSIRVPKGIMQVDLHRYRKKFTKFVLKNKFDVIFSYYRDAFYQYYPHFADKFRWLPQHVYTSVFKDYKLKKTIDYLLMGQIDSNYPLRSRIAQDMSGKPGFVHHKHPGYRNFSDKEQKTLFLNDTYAKEINRAKIFLTDDSVYHYPLGKYFEVAASNTLLLASGSGELRDLGFIDKETFVEINENNFHTKAKYYLRHTEERKKIALRGYQLIRKRHTTEIRVGQFIDYIRALIGSTGRTGRENI
ncbi:glycosyltransferase [Paenibacillus sedimenti]|uniref:Glycosyltransferase n=1 Tax=Paenibacillus sedimenti TaxID=2770274 RepID=A0A926QHV6_9BACL|nr:glycosyltransferase [Paenibacillus sedimenti]MBD0379946.1 glycosyltransferase [Paenibacillus sedimenti]